MGIDVYLKWDRQTESERKAQFTGFSVEAGNVGYLHEAYHGGPYATAVLISERWDDQPDDGFAIPAATLRERLPAAVLTAIYREHVVYESGDAIPAGGADNMVAAMLQCLKEAATAQDNRLDVTPNSEQLRAVSALIEQRKLPKHAMAFADFVALAERKERETGKPCWIEVSY